MSCLLSKVEQVAIEVAFSTVDQSDIRGSSRIIGFEVYLVNARETKNLPGRKSDVQESQWLMKLHTYGLLRNSFRPSQEIRTIRTYWRQRNDLVRSAALHIQRMQKAMTQMNIQLANARFVADINAGSIGMHNLQAEISASNGGR